MKEKYYSVKHRRTISAGEQHQISFEYSRVLEGLPGESHSLAPKRDGVWDYLKKLARIGRPFQTRRGRERYRS